MSQPADNGLEPRVTSLELEMVELRQQVSLSKADAAAARVLASGADRDVSEVRAELRAHTLALNALRETQLEQGRRIDGLEGEMRRGFATLHTGMTEIRTLLGRIAEPG